jgi:hypothetical protein
VGSDGLAIFLLSETFAVYSLVWLVRPAIGRRPLWVQASQLPISVFGAAAAPLLCFHFKLGLLRDALESPLAMPVWLPVLLSDFVTTHAGIPDCASIERLPGAAIHWAVLHGLGYWRLKIEARRGILLRLA